MEDHALAQLDGPGDGVGGQHFFGQHHLRCELAIELGQAVVEHVHPGVVGGVRGLGRVQGVGRGAGLGGDAHLAAALAGLRHDAAAGRQQARAADRHEAAGQQGAHHVAAGETARGLLQRIAGDDGTPLG
jgi:hypothetical protein